MRRFSPFFSFLPGRSTVSPLLRFPSIAARAEGAALGPGLVGGLEIA